MNDDEIDQFNKNIGVVEFTQHDIVRSGLVRSFVKCFNEGDIELWEGVLTSPVKVWMLNSNEKLDKKTKEEGICGCFSVIAEVSMSYQQET